MTKDEILRYVAKTPHNTNPNMIGNMIDALVGGSGSMPKDYPLNNKNVLFNDTIELSLDSEIYVFDSLNPDELPSYSITINNKQAESMTAYGMTVYGIETPEGIIALADGRMEGVDGVVAVADHDAGLVSIQVAEPAIDIDFLKGVKAALRTDHILTTGEEICNQKSILPTQDGESDYYFLNLGTIDLSTLIKVQDQELALTLVEHFEGESTSYTTKLQFDHSEWYGTLDNGQGVYLYFDQDAETESLIGFLDYEGINAEATYDVKVNTLGTALATVEEGVHAAAENTDLFSTEGGILIKETGEHAAYNEQYNQDCFAFSDMASTVSSAGAIQLDIRISSEKKVKPTETEEVTCRFVFKSINELAVSMDSNNHIIKAGFKADENNNLLLFLDPITYDDYDITISKLAIISPAIEQGVNITLQNTSYVPPQPINENQFLISTMQTTPQLLFSIPSQASSTGSGTRKSVKFRGQEYSYSAYNSCFTQLKALHLQDTIYISIKGNRGVSVEQTFTVSKNTVQGDYSASNILVANASNGDSFFIGDVGVEINSVFFSSSASYGPLFVFAVNKEKDLKITSKWISPEDAAKILPSSATLAVHFYGNVDYQGGQTTLTCNCTPIEIAQARMNNIPIKVDLNYDDSFGVNTIEFIPSQLIAADGLYTNSFFACMPDYIYIISASTNNLAQTTMTLVLQPYGDWPAA